MTSFIPNHLEINDPNFPFNSFDMRKCSSEYLRTVLQYHEIMINTITEEYEKQVNEFVSPQSNPFFNSKKNPSHPIFPFNAFELAECSPKELWNIRRYHQNMFYSCKNELKIRENNDHPGALHSFFSRILT